MQLSRHKSGALILHHSKEEEKQFDIYKRVSVLEERIKQLEALIKGGFDGINGWIHSKNR